jgi:hypothetical protein
MTHKEFYDAANLTENPFRANPVLEEDPRMSIWVGYEKQQRDLIKLLERTRADQHGNVYMGLVYGALGTGKTHALLWAKYQIMKRRKEEFDSVAFYVQSLLKGKGLSFAGAFSEDIVSKSNLLAEVLSFRQFIRECIVDYKKVAKKPRETDKEVLEKIIPPDLHEIAERILNCENESDVRDLLTVKTDYEALLLFSKIVNLFVYDIKRESGSCRFKKAMYLFIDEMDILAECSAKEGRDINMLIRHIYDLCPYCFGMLLAFSGTAAEVGIIYNDYVQERVAKHIVLDYLQPDEAKDFVKAILDTARVDKKKNTGYYPFHEDAIDAVIATLVQITPRKLVMKMQQIIEECRLAGIDPKDGLITAQVLTDKNIWEEIP